MLFLINTIIVIQVIWFKFYLILLINIDGIIKKNSIITKICNYFSMTYNDKN